MYIVQSRDNKPPDQISVLKHLAFVTSIIFMNRHHDPQNRKGTKRQKRVCTLTSDKGYYYIIQMLTHSSIQNMNVTYFHGLDDSNQEF